MARKNRQCICCQTQYSYCPNCGGSDRLKPSWYAEFCSEDCKDLWMTATNFNMGLINKSDAAKTILSLQLKDKSQYVNCIQQDLENIFKEEPKAKRVKPEVVHEVVDQENE